MNIIFLEPMAKTTETLLKIGITEALDILRPYNADDQIKVEPDGTVKLPVRAEYWRSSESREEVHFFIEGTSVYVAGFNPKFTSYEEMRHFIREKGFKL